MTQMLTKPLAAALLLCCFSTVAADVKVYDLTCEYKTNPMGIDVLQPRLSWKLQVGPDDKNVTQTAYRVQVAATNDFKQMLWDSKKVQSGQSIHLAYEGPDLVSKQRYYWRVRVWDNQKGSSDWSEVGFWEMGLLNGEDDWQASWITYHRDFEGPDQVPSPYLRKSFDLKSKPVKARLYVTGKGVYHARLNGQEISEDIFAPGWTSYEDRIQYQVYDVTDLLRSGENIAGVILSPGWYRGKLGWEGRNFNFGNELALRYQLEVSYSDGSSELMVSDDSWSINLEGPYVYSEIYDGTLYDARKELTGWDRQGYRMNDSWEAVKLHAHEDGMLVARQGAPIRRIEELPALKLFTTPKGEQVIDFGQNMVGRVRFTLSAKAGDKIRISHAEVLDKEGNFYTNNLRGAEQIVEYIFADNQEVTFEPSFTFQGFRYIKVEGVDAFEADDFVGVVIHSLMEPAGTFETSDVSINQLQQNIIWGQKGNFVDVPTDCPQRDERMGWTGDAQVFASTACFNFDVAPFFTKWMGDVRADQRADGSIPFVIPDVLYNKKDGARVGAAGSTGWGDVVTILPWTMYEKYGDKRILEQSYDNMKAWVEFLKERSGDDFIGQEGFSFGDWLFFIHPTSWNTKPGYTDIDFINTAFFAYSTSLLVKAAEVLGRKEDLATYSDLLQKIKTAFQGEFVSGKGRLSPHSQTSYVLALHFDLLEEEQRPYALNYLIENIERRGFHLSTGFLGTPYLCYVLSDNGREDIAYRLLMQDTYPSWLYPISRGATTIWERWDGIKPDSTFQNEGMNSFNHYAYGAIGDWMYTNVGGIRPGTAGYKEIIISPKVNGDLNYANTSLETPYGKVATSWKRTDSQVSLEVTIPPNTTANVQLPGRDEQRLGSGRHQFEYAIRLEAN